MLVPQKNYFSMQFLGNGSTVMLRDYSGLSSIWQVTKEILLAL